jgi:hypothetical protein
MASFNPLPQISEVVTSAESLVGLTETSDGIEIGIEDTRASVAADSESVANDWDQEDMVEWSRSATTL